MFQFLVVGSERRPSHVQFYPRTQTLKKMYIKPNSRIDIGPSRNKLDLDPIFKIKILVQTLCEEYKNTPIQPEYIQYVP